MYECSVHVCQAKGRLTIHCERRQEKASSNNVCVLSLQHCSVPQLSQLSRNFFSHDDYRWNGWKPFSMWKLAGWKSLTGRRLMSQKHGNIAYNLLEWRLECTTPVCSNCGGTHNQSPVLLLLLGGTIRGVRVVRWNGNKKRDSLLACKGTRGRRYNNNTIMAYLLLGLYACMHLSMRHATKKGLPMRLWIQQHSGSGSSVFQTEICGCVNQYPGRWGPLFFIRTLFSFQNFLL